MRGVRNAREHKVRARASLAMRGVRNARERKVRARASLAMRGVRDTGDANTACIPITRPRGYFERFNTSNSTANGKMSSIAINVMIIS